MTKKDFAFLQIIILNIKYKHKCIYFIIMHWREQTNRDYKPIFNQANN